MRTKVARVCGLCVITKRDKEIMIAIAEKNAALAERKSGREKCFMANEGPRMEEEATKALAQEKEMERLRPKLKSTKDSVFISYPKSIEYETPNST